MGRFDSYEIDGYEPIAKIDAVHAVWKVRCTADGSTRALKCFTGSLRMDADQVRKAVAQRLRAAELQKQVASQSANWLKVIDAGELDLGAGMYYVTDLCDGSFERVIQRKIVDGPVL